MGCPDLGILRTLFVAFIAAVIGGVFAVLIAASVMGANQNSRTRYDR